MKNRRWLKIYSEDDSSIQVGIYPDDEEYITVETEHEGEYGAFIRVKLNLSEAEDLISFI